MSSSQERLLLQSASRLSACGFNCLERAGCLVLCHKRQGSHGCRTPAAPQACSAASCWPRCRARTLPRWPRGLWGPRCLPQGPAQSLPSLRSSPASWLLCHLVNMFKLCLCFKNFCLEPETVSAPGHLRYPALVSGSLVMFWRNGASTRHDISPEVMLLQLCCGKAGCFPQCPVLCKGEGAGQSPSSPHEGPNCACSRQWGECAEQGPRSLLPCDTKGSLGMKPGCCCSYKQFGGQGEEGRDHLQEKKSFATPG